MDVSVEVVLNTKTLNGLKRVPDIVMRKVARQTLDMSYTTIPKSNRKHNGKLRSSSMAGGVKKDSTGYYIGSYTSYASYVWNMEGVHWTTPRTNNKWYLRTLKKHGKTIINNAINQGWRDVM